MGQENSLSKNKTLGDSLSVELLDTSIDLSIDYSEIYIDSLMNNEGIKDLPIVKTLLAFVKTGISINQLFFTKKILTFIKEFNSGEIDSQKLQEFKFKLEEDSTFRNKAMEQIMIFNDRFIELQQSKISAQLFKSYVNGEISYEDFVSLNIFLERLHPKAYKLMQNLEAYNYEIIDDTISRDWEAESILLSSGLGTEPGDFWSGFRLSKDGVKLYKYGIKPILT